MAGAKSQPDKPENVPSGDYLTPSIRGVVAAPSEGSCSLQLAIETIRGELRGLLDAAKGEVGAVIFVNGAMGGPHEVPASGERVFETLARTLAPKGVTSLRLRYRHAGELADGILDILAGCSILQGIGADKIALVGHSFGGAVVIKAGELAPIVVAVASLLPQLVGSRRVEK